MRYVARFRPYYWDHFDKIKNVISNFDYESATVIEKTNLKNNLAYISTNFGFLIQN